MLMSFALLLSAIYYALSLGYIPTVKAQAFLVVGIFTFVGIIVSREEGFDSVVAVASLAFSTVFIFAVGLMAGF